MDTGLAGQLPYANERGLHVPVITDDLRMFRTQLLASQCMSNKFKEQDQGTSQAKRMLEPRATG